MMSCAGASSAIMGIMKQPSVDKICSMQVGELTVTSAGASLLHSNSSLEDTGHCAGDAAGGGGGGVVSWAGC